MCKAKILFFVVFYILVFGDKICYYMQNICIDDIIVSALFREVDRRENYGTKQEDCITDEQ